MMRPNSPLRDDDDIHTLLDPPSPAYSDRTIRRAFIVWLHCGQRNEFKQACNYFHNLETMEEKLSVEQRCSSRVHEFYILEDNPPSSMFLNDHFPYLYRKSTIFVNVKEVNEVLDNCVFNQEGFYDIRLQSEVTAKDIIKTSKVIKTFCKIYTKTLRKFLAEFQDFVKKVRGTNTVNFILLYIKNIYIRDELQTHNNMPKSFSFLDDEDNNNIDIAIEAERNYRRRMIKIDRALAANRSANKIKTLIKQSRRKELMHLDPTLSDQSNKKCEQHCAYSKEKKKKSKNHYHDKSQGS